MIKKPDDLLKLVSLLRKNGISRLKDGDFEIEVHASAFFPESSYQLKKKAKADLKTDEPKANLVEEMEKTLFWSASQMPGEAAQ